MLLHIVELLHREHRGSHVLEGDALIGQNGRGQPGAQPAGAQALDILLRDAVVALPQCLQRRGVHLSHGLPQLLRLGQKPGQILPWQAVGIPVHLFGRGKQKSHRLSPFKKASTSPAFWSGLTLGITF